MTVVTLRPNGNISNTGTVTGAGSASAALSDNSDASFVELDAGEGLVCTLSNVSLPAETVVTGVAVRARTGATVDVVNVLCTSQVPSGGADTAGGTITVSWAQDSPLTVQAGPRLLGDFLSDVNDADIRASMPSGASPVRVFELYFDVFYAVQPTVVVDDPTGTITTTNLPLVSWTPTIDPDAGTYASWSLFIYTAAQYGIGGFTPGVSPATYGRGQGNSTGTGAATSHQVAEPLANGTYRAYVKVGRSDSILTPHESDWAYSSFVINVALPAVPTITVTAESPSGRNKIELASNAGAATTDALDLERSLDAGTTWVPVRHAAGLVSRVTGTSGTWYDYEAPNGVTVTYRARALHNYSGLFAASAWAQASGTWASTDWWLKAPLAPALNRTVTLMTYGDVVRAARQGHFQPLGATATITVRDTRASATGASTIRTHTTAERDEFEAVAALPATLLFQGPLVAGEPDRYISAGDLSATRFIENVGHPWRIHTMPWTETSQPDGATSGAEFTGGVGGDEELIFA